MKQIKQYFNKEQQDMLSGIGISLSDEIDYSDDDLLAMHGKITERYLDEGFDKYGESTDRATSWEALIDLFLEKFDI